MSKVQRSRKTYPTRKKGSLHYVGHLDFIVKDWQVSMCKRKPVLKRFQASQPKDALTNQGEGRGRSKKGGSHGVEIPGVAKAANCGQSQKGSNVAEASDMRQGCFPYISRGEEVPSV